MLTLSSRWYATIGGAEVEFCVVVAQNSVAGLINDCLQKLLGTDLMCEL